MLMSANQAAAAPSRRLVLRLVATLVVWALPTLQRAMPGAEAQSTSRILVTVFLRKENTFENVIISVDPATGKWQRLGDGANVHSLRLSPDKQTLLFAKHQDGIWTCAANEVNERRRVMYTGSLPVWSPDGKQVIANDGKFEEDRGWKHSTWRANVDGTELVRLPIPEEDEVDDWSADGKWVVTVSDRHPPRGSGYQLYVMRPDGTDQRRLTQGGLNVYPRFSPDGQSIVYTHQDKNGNSVWVVNIDGTGAREVLKADGAMGTAANGAACWSPDGKQLVVHRYDWELDDKGRKIKRAGNDHSDRLEVLDADGKNIRQITLEDLRPLDMGHPEWR